VLVLVMMLLLVLTGLSLVVVQSTVNSMSRGGSYRASAVAFQVAQAGSEATMAIAAKNPAEFLKFVAAHDHKVQMADVSGTFFDLSADGSFGREYANVGGANWVSTVRSAGQPNCNVPGYQSSYCFYKYYSVTDGWYGIGDAAVDEPDEVLRNPQKRFMATILVGPMPAANL
jgi:hypothetical protein